MGLLTQLGLLLWKNFILRKRQKVPAPPPPPPHHRSPSPANQPPHACWRCPNRGVKQGCCHVTTAFSVGATQVFVLRRKNGHGFALMVVSWQCELHLFPPGKRSAVSLLPVLPQAYTVDSAVTKASMLLMYRVRVLGQRLSLQFSHLSPSRACKRSPHYDTGCPGCHVVQTALVVP